MERLGLDGGDTTTDDEFGQSLAALEGTVLDGDDTARHVERRHVVAIKKCTIADTGHSVGIALIDEVRGYVDSSRIIIGILSHGCCLGRGVEFVIDAINLNRCQATDWKEPANERIDE